MVDFNDQFVIVTGAGQAIVDRALEHFGRLDAVISNAGIFSTAAFEDLDAEEWRRRSPAVSRLHLR